MHLDVEGFLNDPGGHVVTQVDVREPTDGGGQFDTQLWDNGSANKGDGQVV